jgi:hypothetical protein
MIRIAGDEDESAFFNNSYERSLARVPRPSKRVIHENAEHFPEEKFNKIRVDCDNNPSGLIKSVPLERIKKGRGFVWECHGRCSLNEGKEVKVRLGFLAREIKGRQRYGIRVVECHDKDWFNNVK